MIYRLLNSLLLLLTFGLLLSSSLDFPIELSVSQYKKYFPHEISTFTQYVNIDIKTGDNIKKESDVILELFLILDTSGSMGGENKLSNGKLAIESIIRNMNKNDKLHLVEYNSYSSIVFENENNQQFMLNKIRNLYPSGGTNLMSGFDNTKILLNKYSKRKSLKRIFVFSDGQINEGITAHDQLLKEVTIMKNTYELTICSFGIGSDFDEKLMTNIADYGSGDYFFIHGSDSMKKVVDIAYKGFQLLIGTNAYLKITTKNDAHIVDTFGYENVKHDEDEIISIGDIRYNDQMNILLQTEIQISEKFLEKSQIDYMIIELWMTDINNQISKLIKSEKVLFSLSKNDEELNDLNKLIEYLVQLKTIERREDQVTQLLKERRKNEASQLNQQIKEQRKVAIQMIRESAINDPGLLIVAENYIDQSEVMNRRSDSLKRLLDDDQISSEESFYVSSSNSKLNMRYKKSHADL